GVVWACTKGTPKQKHHAKKWKARTLIRHHVQEYGGDNYSKKRPRAPRSPGRLMSLREAIVKRPITSRPLGWARRSPIALPLAYLSLKKQLQSILNHPPR